MKWPAVTAIAAASALGGAALTGWIVSTSQPTPPAGIMATNLGYVGPAGVPVGPMPAGIPNNGLMLTDPYANSPQGIAEGHRLYEAMNCAGCHGYKGVGGMGPALNDDYWRYGGTPVQVYKSIHEGRPKGMPAWGVVLPPSEIWALTAYVGTLGGAPEPPESGAGAPGSNSGPPNSPEPSKSGAGLEGQ